MKFFTIFCTLYLTLYLTQGEKIKNWDFNIQGLLDRNIRNKAAFRNKDQSLVVSVREAMGYKFFESSSKFVFLLTKTEEERVKEKIKSYIDLIQLRGDQMKNGVRLDHLGLPYDNYGTLDLGSFSNVKQIYRDGESYGSEETSNCLFYVASMLGKTKFLVSFDFSIENPLHVELNLVNSRIDNKKKEGNIRKFDLSRSGHGSTPFIEAQLDFDERKMNSRFRNLDQLFAKNELRKLNLMAYKGALGKIKLFGNVKDITDPQKQAKFITATNIARQRESQLQV